MPKNIIICSDGTGNVGVKNRGTNVYKLFESINVHTENPKQIAFYDDGVGTQRLRLLSVPCKALGFGLRENIFDLYEAISRVYEDGDQLYFFGFSRGAFTVRMLAGLIAYCGIADGRCSTANIRSISKRAWRAYRYRYATWIMRKLGRKTREDAEKEIEMFRTKHEVRDPDIYFIGVWDTVDAYGLPFESVVNFWNTFVYRYTFPDHDLNDKVHHARQALAIDDERRSFHPKLWNGTKSKNTTVVDERIRQVWFPGVHSDVGGGYPKHGLSLLALDWMVSESERCAAECKNRLGDNPSDEDLLRSQGLKLIDADRKYIKDRSNSDDTMHNSRSGPAAYYQYAPRNITAMCEARKMEVIIHDSAVRRIWRATQGYSPRVLPSEFSVENTGEGVSHTKCSIPGRPVYESVGRTIHVRKWNQRGIYVLTVSLALLVVSVQWGSHGFTSVPGMFMSPLRLIDGLRGAYQDQPIILSVIAILYLALSFWSVRLRRKISRTCTAQWDAWRLDAPALASAPPRSGKEKDTSDNGDS